MIKQSLVRSNRRQIIRLRLVYEPINDQGGGYKLEPLVINVL